MILIQDGKSHNSSVDLFVVILTNVYKIHPWFATSISFDLEPEITMPTSCNIVVLDDLDYVLSDDNDLGRGMARVFCEPFLLNSFCHKFEKLMRDKN